MLAFSTEFTTIEAFCVFMQVYYWNTPYLIMSTFNGTNYKNK
jgi:hypothetical protein